VFYKRERYRITEKRLCIKRIIKIIQIEHFMKKLLALITLIFAFAQINAQTKLDFILENQTGDILYGMHISSSTDSEWGSDIIPSSVLGDGDDVRITFNAVTDDTECEWDIKLDSGFSEDDFRVILGVDLCSVRKITVYKNEDGEYYSEIEL
jgi:hypothetical protein